MNATPEPTIATTVPTDPYTFSSRLFLTYILAGVCYVSTDKSIFLLALAFIAWAIFTVRLIWRFRLRGLLALAGAPLALFWLFLITRPPPGGVLV